MKRVLNGVQVLMAIGLVVALAACGGNEGALKRDRDQAQAAAAAAEADKMAAEAAAAQAEADKMAAEAATAQAEADKMAAEAAAAQAEADKMAADEAAALAEADKMAAEAAAALAEAEKMAAEAAKMAAEAAAAQAEAEKMAADEAAALAEAEKMAAEAAAALAEADKMAAEAAAALAAAEKMAADEAAALAEAEKMAAEAALAQAEADKKALEDELAGVPKTIEELEAALKAATDANTAAQEAMAAADTALEEATAARTAAQTAVDESDPAGLTDAIDALQAARDAVSAAEVAAMAAADVATAAEADVATADTALKDTDTGPASEDLAEQAAEAAIAGARKAFALLDSIPRADDTATTDVNETLPRRETATDLKVSRSGDAVKFSATMTDDTTDRTTTVFSQADANMAPTITGWPSATLTGKKGGNDATGLTYSNIEAPKDKLFAVVYGAEVLFGDAGATANAQWARSKVPAANTYTGGGGGGSIPGSYRGVDGTFTCEDSGCPASADFPERRSNGSIIDTEGTVAAVPGSTWKFEPTNEAAMVTVADNDYLSFGYWLSKNKGDPVGFGVWYEGSADVAETGEIDTLDEKVTYTGAAAGKYVIKDDVPNLAHAGYFTAIAELTADFTVEAETDDSPGKVKGTISSFKDGDDTPLGDLTLTLTGNLWYDDTAGSLTVLTADDDTNTAIVTAKSGGLDHKTVGEWEAQFFGTDKTTNVPTGVAGAFNATIEEQAIVVGGFGATK